MSTVDGEKREVEKSTQQSEDCNGKIKGIFY